MRFLGVGLIGFGCTGSNLSGSWDGSVVCGDEQDYTIEAAINPSDESFVYKGGMLFQYIETLFISGDEVGFTVNFLYDFTVTQPIREGAQDVYFNVTWNEVGCELDYPESEDERGTDVCEQQGIDLSVLGEDIGDVVMRFDGSNRLTMDDNFCEGYIER